MISIIKNIKAQIEEKYDEGPHHIFLIWIAKVVQKLYIKLIIDAIRYILLIMYDPLH